MDLNKDQEQLLRQVQQASEAAGTNPQEQVIIEDGTMSAFGFSNPCEIKVNR